MIAVDTNVLVYAHREEMPLHSRALVLLRSLAEGDAVWGIPAPCLVEFVRVVTHAHVFTPPTELGVALDFLDAIFESPTVRLLAPGAEFLTAFRAQAVSGNATGNLAFDAQIAAICLEAGADELLTADRDFARFAAIRVRPLVDLE